MVRDYPNTAQFQDCIARDQFELSAVARNLTDIRVYTPNAYMAWTSVNDYQTVYDFNFNGTCGYGIRYSDYDPVQYSGHVFLMMGVPKNVTSGVQLRATVATCDGSVEKYDLSTNGSLVVFLSPKIFIYVERAPVNANDTRCPEADQVSYALSSLEDYCDHPDQSVTIPECKNAKAKVVETSPPPPSPVVTSNAGSSTKRSHYAAAIMTFVMVVGGLSPVC